ncbi:MAG TPA: class I SAM-dependent methyltransferase [Symbiobacteriaceae bacterium]|nr:class I SAM-dependent methyltransferase [Symbiobacteriaceae bacterium]
MADAMPLVSCLCPTYGRPRLLREAIWSFLQQDYPNKELVIVNDHPNAISLDRPYPGVVVHNLPARLATMGQKRNETARLARGEILLNWDDDDLYLPWRITDTVRHLAAAPDKWVFKATRAWHSTDNGRYHIAHNYFHGQAAMRRTLFDHVGWYPEMNAGEDVVFEAGIPRERWLHFPATPSELMYLYRWGNGVTHISELGPDRPGQPSGYEIIARRYGAEAGGVVTPGFDRDYWRNLTEAAAQLPDVSPVELHALTQRLAPHHDLGAPGAGYLTDWVPETFRFPGQERVDALFAHNNNMMMNREAQFLAYLATKAPADRGSFVEIGSRSGKSAAHLAQVAVNRGRGPIFSIDLWDQAPARWSGTGTLEGFLALMEQLGLKDAVVALKGDSRVIGAAWQKPISLLFVDGDHSYEGALSDYQRFSPHIVPGGIIAFHDYCHSLFPDVRRVIDEVVLSSGLWTDPYVLREHNGIWCARKRRE